MSRRYRIIRAVGRGGFGTVYQADLLAPGGFRKPVALKMLDPELPDTADIVQRLRDEARMLALIRHRSIVGVDALLQLHGRWTVVMEYVPGVSLDAFLHARPLPLRPAVEVVGEVADALHAAHSAEDAGQPLRLVHRDLKPANVQLTASGEVKLLDFGIARGDFAEREAMTRQLMYGSIAYMAPERWERKEVPAGDIFSLGVVFYELLTSTRLGRCYPDPERHEEKIDTATSKLRVHRSIVELLRAMLAFEPEDRPTAREVERTCRAIAPSVPGPWLRDWAESEIPRMLGAKVSASAADPLTGTLLVEPESGDLADVQNVTGPAGISRPVLVGLGVVFGPLLGIGLLLAGFALGWVSSGP